MSITQGVKRNVQQNCDGNATTFGSRTQSWGQFQDRVARLAGGLKSLGVAPGDRVAILALNSDRYLEYFVAVPWAGAVLVPLNIRWSVAENVYSLNDSGAVVLLVDDAFSKMAAPILAESKSIRAVIHIGDATAPAEMIGYERLIERSAPVADAGRGGEDLAGIFYTGGTTGFPKGVMLPHRGLWASAAALVGSVAIRHDSIYLHAAPMFHLADGAMTMATLLAGSSHVMIPAFNPEHVLAAIERHRVSHILLVPTMINMVVSHPKLAQSDLSSLQQLLYGASPIPEALLIQAMRAMPKCRFTQAYGQTELSPVATILTSDYHTIEGTKAGRLKSAGRAAICNEIEIVDVNGVEVPRGTVGEVRARGPNTMLGYWNKPKETAAALRDGWVYTGDAAYMDDEGFIYVVDRVKDMIVSGGENVYSAEVENAVTKHPAVAQCAVIGVPSDTWGEAVHAIVILKEAQRVAAEAIIAHCHTLIAGYKCPRSIEFRTEPMPLSGAGKVLKRELRKPYWEGKTRQVN
ncbi:MAG TPA: long-chain fatty acid--CoA ligase [Stellaceae bacterium]|nr:long-chain fatty acid--CoA ligase [Stellaceae bacterium]